MNGLETRQSKLNVKAPEPVLVVLKSWQVDWAAYAGAQRTARNVGQVVDKPDYTMAPKSLQTDIEANTASCLCELATSIALNQRWNGPYWHPDLHRAEPDQGPDIGYNIEVRRTRTIGGDIPVKPYEPEKKIRIVQAYIADEELQAVLACDDTMKFQSARVSLLCAIDADIAWARGVHRDSKGEPSEKRWCNPKWAYSVSELLGMV
jgi:hypothetical protein